MRLANSKTVSIFVLKGGILLSKYSEIGRETNDLDFLARKSDRTSNLFVLTLLPHHLFDSQDIQWLQSFKDHNLTNEEPRTFIIIRERGAISNAEYRTINSVDTAF